MTPSEFVTKWSTPPASLLNEEQGAQSYFLDLCALLDVPPPGTIDGYRFEEKATMIGARTGFADVFYPNHFVWENKKPDGNLDEALKQLLMYSHSLNNPPLLVVCDRKRIQIHSRFTGHPSGKFLFTLEDMDSPVLRSILRRVWTDVEHFRPHETCRDITERAANTFAIIAEGMRKRGCVADEVAHFLTQCVFCFFAESIGILPTPVFVQLLRNRYIDSKNLRKGLHNLFATMHDGGMFGAEEIPWFNGGLFRVVNVPELTIMEITELRHAAAMNWSAIDASILGTLFERGLDPAKRSQLGAHYTDPATIQRITDPVLTRPLHQKWELAMQEIRAFTAQSKKKNDKHYKAARVVFTDWLEHLKAFRLLDPACGSGNFLFMGLKALKDLELQTHLDAVTLGLDREADLVTGPHNVLGIEINEYAAELARITVWIGELQWRLEHKFPFKLHPVLAPLDLIDQRDALLAINPQTGEVTEATWPKADIVMSNPPFIGGSKKRRELGDAYFDALDTVFTHRVPGGADLVCYWFERAQTQIAAGLLRAAGLVSTQAIRAGSNRVVLDTIGKNHRVFEAWSNNEWVNEGAGVRISITCFGQHEFTTDTRLNGESVSCIHTDLTDGMLVDLTQSQRLAVNAHAIFEGTKKYGQFDIAGNLAREWLKLPNVGGKSNALVLKPWRNGRDLATHPSDKWIIDFGTHISEHEAQLFEAPYAHILANVKPERSRINLLKNWWLHERPRPELRKALSGLPRYLATTRVAKHRIFVFLHPSILPDTRLNVVARADDVTFGVLSSRIHAVWSLAQGSIHGCGTPTYNAKSCFETFPFPENFTPADTAHQRVEEIDGVLIPAGLEGAIEIRRKTAVTPVDIAQAAPKTIAYNIAKAAHHLNELRENWLNPPEWTHQVPEIVPHGMTESPYPDRILPKPDLDEFALTNLQERTLTHLYNYRPPWLKYLHEQLDIAVAHAYGWHDYTPEMPDNTILARLLQLNIYSLDQHHG
ncbi:MAG: hypothetical protein RIR79_6 [Pseudomonadota bacterium]|jgi:hypothetical protein